MMTRSVALALVVLGLRCDRPVADAGAADARHAQPEASAQTQHAARSIVSVGYADQNASGGVNITCTRDGVVSGSYFNAGFSSAGAEVVPINKNLTKARASDLFGAADAVVQAIPVAHEVVDASWHGSSSLTVHFSEGADDTFVWPREGAHADKRVQHLAALLIQAL